jgi:glycosyltransferase involved in cell wall biosynthesis
VNIFVIPSWFPSDRAPINGIFIKEQVEELGREYDDLNMIVSTWGHLSSYITGRSLLYDARSLFWLLMNKTKAKVIKRDGYTEVSRPSLTWTLRKSMGGLSKLVSINERNLETAQKHFGKIDLIHAHVTFPAGYIASYLASKFNIPYVITEHMGPFPFKSLMKKGKPIDEIITGLKGARSVIAVSPSLANSIKKYDVPSTIVIPNYVDEHKFTIGSNDKKFPFVFFTLCDISFSKGVDTLISAFSEIDFTKINCELHIGGTGKDIQKFKRFAVKLNIENRVKWLHKINRENVPLFFQKGNCFVMPSRYETFGIVYTEALACGKPIIATKCGGPESIVNKQNGILVDIDDVRGLKNAMETIYYSFDQYSSQEIRNDFMKRFSKSAVLNQIIKVYKTNC